MIGLSSGVAVRAVSKASMQVCFGMAAMQMGSYKDTVFDLECVICKIQITRPPSSSFKEKKTKHAKHEDVNMGPLWGVIY